MNDQQSNPKYPGIPVTTNGNQLVAYYTEARIAEGGVFFPITPSTEMGENFELSFAKGELTAFGNSKVAIETEGEHAAQCGAITYSVTGKRVSNFTSGQGLVYGAEQYYHAPGKLSTMIVNVGARALTKHALNVHCGHDDVCAMLDTGWTVVFAMNAQQAADHCLILRKVNELSLNPGISAQDGFLTTHLERTFLKVESELIREFLGRPEDIIDSPTEAQRTLFGPKRRRVPKMIDLENPILLGPVQNQEHYMGGVAARRNHFSEDILGFFEQAYKEFGELTGRHYGLITKYNCEKADTIFVSIGSSHENIRAVIDYLRETRNIEVGAIHLNVVRPFPQAAIIDALRGKKNVLVLERTDEQLATDNPITRDIKVALSKGLDNNRSNAHDDLPKLSEQEIPQIFSYVYGLGSRDFRPEHIIGAYDFANGNIARQDGKKAADGKRFCYLGINHDYAVSAKETPSCLPKGSIAVRFHSIGGWGMITTGKNLGEILGEFSNYIAKRDNLIDSATGRPQEVLHISANPKYGSEKKGAPTNYFLVVAPERIRVNCDLRHVNVVLCCDPKIFTHANPLVGLTEGGVFVWESSETDVNKAWERIPRKFRQEIIDKKIRIFLLDGFAIAEKATKREDLQKRMQGNAFLGAFFAVSPFLKDNNVPKEEYLQAVRAQYVKKFGRFGEDVVESNMTVMQAGFERVRELPLGDVNAPDTANMRGTIIDAVEKMAGCGSCASKAPLFTTAAFNAEYRGGYGYDQPASPLASVGMVATATGSTVSKYVARTESPMYIPENCTQCMDCIIACPDTALPNTAQDIATVLHTAFKHYTADTKTKETLLAKAVDIEAKIRKQMVEIANSKKQEDNKKFGDLVNAELDAMASSENLDVESIDRLKKLFAVLPFSFAKTANIFKKREKKEAGSGGLFGIFVNDRCKGCGECVDVCGHDALHMVTETENVNGNNVTAYNFLDLLPETDGKYMAPYSVDTPQNAKAATLQYHLMQRSKYEALVAGDGACAGCGEKSVLHSLTTITEAYMRPIYHAKAERLRDKVKQLREKGLHALNALKERDQNSYRILRRSILHFIMGFGRETAELTDVAIEKEFAGNDQELVDALIAVLEQDAFNHKDLQVLDGFEAHGMSVLAMGASTGCNTVYGSTPPNNPHTYPWMNALFQDGATVTWLIGESFIADHSRRSVLPERFTDILLGAAQQTITEQDYFDYGHFTDALMTDHEIAELPKAWAVGGDGAFGDIGFQNVSKVVMQNRPNVKLLMLDTQVYSNTGGQNSDSSVMPGGFDMNQFGAARQGKYTEKKSVAEALTCGHGSPFVAQVSMANSGNLYKSLMDALTYRGTAFLQCYTPCQVEHGIPDYSSARQSLKARDSRAIPEFTFDSAQGENYQDALSLKGNPNLNYDWQSKKHPQGKGKYNYTVAHWALTEARFRRHSKKISEEEAAKLISLDDMLLRITQNDVVHRRFLDENHRSYVPDFGVYIMAVDDEGNISYHSLSRMMILFCVERRKSWRMLQSRAGTPNHDYAAQKALLQNFDEGKIAKDDFFSPKIQELLNSYKQ